MGGGCGYGTREGEGRRGGGGGGGSKRAQEQC